MPKIVPPGVHVVAQGEGLTSLAVLYRFADPLTIWSHPRNASLRARRDSPEVLSPGDEVFVPAKVASAVQRSAGEKHVFRLASPPAKIELIFLDAFGAALEGEWELSLDGASYRGTLQAGWLIQAVPASARSGEVKLRYQRGDGERSVETYPIEIGSLDPIATVPGVKARLDALGYPTGPLQSAWGYWDERALDLFERMSRGAGNDAPGLALVRLENSEVDVANTTLHRLQDANRGT